MKTIHVLSIGNSYSQDAQRYLHDLARSEGVAMETVNLYIGGCPLERHFRNLVGDREEYTLQVNGHAAEGFMIGITEALTARAWDVVTLQQASHFSYREDTYYPYINELADYVRSVCPKAKILIHQTWGYEDGSDRIHNQGFETYDEMFAAIRSCYDKAAESIGADGILPGGLAFQYALHHGVKKIHRDTFHASYGLGRFILGLVWYGMITGNDVSTVNYHDFDEEVSEEEYRTALEAAAYAVEQYRA
ncbi:MAG: DUF4886 domain-containing protein [Lachnospiraceae bacterium]|nr:DUF4886 domain-containing protein [Lachnospiraceae bacterium]